MVNVNSLVISCSKQMEIDNRQVFNVHIEDYTDLTKYIFADILLPDYTVTDSAEMSESDLDYLKKYCKEHYDALLALSIQEDSE